jgi:hypothetical protein
MLSQSSFERGFVDIQKKVVRKLKAAKIQHKIMTDLDQALTGALMEDMIVLSRTERKHLLTQVTQTLLEDMLQKLKAAGADK